MAATPINCNSISSPCLTETSEEQFLNKVVEKVQLIANDYLTRISEYHTNISQLSRGYFYGNEYYRALKELGNNGRIYCLKQKHAFFNIFSNSPYFEPICQNLVRDLANDAFIPGIRIKKDRIVRQDTLTGELIREDVKPSEALNSLKNHLVFMGCGEACQIAYYLALLEILGQEKFDIIFAYSSKTPLSICFEDMQRNPVYVLFSDKKYLVETELKKGDMVYFQNSPEYETKHYTGEGKGFWTIVCSENGDKIKKFTGFGLKPEGITSEELKEVFRLEFNKSPLLTNALSEQLAPIVQKQAGFYANHELRELIDDKQYTSKEEFEESCSVIKYLHSKKKVVHSLNFARIQELILTPPGSIRQLFDAWHEEYLKNIPVSSLKRECSIT